MPPVSSNDVRIVTTGDIPVAVLEHRGDPRGIPESVRRFIAWRKQHRLPPSMSATYNLVYDDIATTPPEHYRFDLCAATEQPVDANLDGIVGKTIVGGRWAVLRHIGSDDTLDHTVRTLYTEWLPQSGETLRDAPLMFQRLRLASDVPEHEAVTDVLLPLR